MAFLSLYRKYRPEDFSDIVGQKHVVRTLRNALKHDRVAHAYLFAGPRGTGKTSTAKVFARALNCDNPGDDLEPCGLCNACQKIAKGNSIDVIEIDAASNRGIDEIRDLREKVKFYPGEGQYKVYIIDEVHMLTKGAFNALLKTLEEPPESVIFILATTEPHKVITTILSRCQRLDFSLLGISDIKQRLNYICQAEGYQVSDEALSLIAHSSRGGMRDAISLLDQAISFSDGELSVDAIQTMLGKVERKALANFINDLTAGDTSSALNLVNDLLSRGLGSARFIEDLIEYCRELLLVKECGIDSGILEYSVEYLNQLSEEAEQLATGRLTAMIDILTDIDEKLKYSSQPRLLLEIAVVKMSVVEYDNYTNTLEERISELEYQLRKLANSQTNIKTSPAKMQENDDMQEEIVKEEPAEEVSANDVNESEQPNKSAKVVSTQNSAFTLDDVKNAWPAILNYIRQEDVSVQALLREGEPVKVAAGKLVIAFPGDKKFHYKGAQRNETLISKVCRNVLSQVVELEFIIGSEDKQDQANAGDELEEESKKKQGNNQKMNGSESSPTNSTDNHEDKLEKLARMFSGEIVKVDRSVLNKKQGG